MSTYLERLAHLIDEAEESFSKAMEWKSQPSENYSDPSLKISSYGYEGDLGLYTELIYLCDRWILCNEDGYQFNLDCLETYQIMELADKIQHVNPYDSEAKVFPVLDYDGDEDLSVFPNFSVTGSVSGMKKQYYGKGSMLLRKGKYIYNVTSQPEIYLEVYDPDDEEMED